MKTPSPPKKKRVKRDNICDIGSSPALRKNRKMQKTEIKFIQKKMQSPTKKITRSPHLPPAKKNIPPPHKKSPAKKKTPAMNTSPATKIQEGNGSKVKMARMKIEEKIRKEKRAKLIDQIRKPLLNTPGTPGSKRARNAEEVWEESQDDQAELPGLPAKSEGGSGNTAMRMGGLIWVEEHQNANAYEAATHAGGKDSALGKYQNMPDLLPKPEGVRGEPAIYRGGITSVEEQQNADEAVTLAGGNHPAMGEYQTVPKQPAMPVGGRRGGHSQLQGRGDKCRDNRS